MKLLLPLLVLVVLGACQSPAADTSLFTTTPVITSVSDGSSTGSTSSASSSGTTTTTGESGSGDGDTHAEPPRDLGTMPDFGDGAPAGCAGKIDFLFMISRSALMAERQAQLALAVPQFIDTIKTKFADFDYHIMVVDGDGPPPGAWWGSSTCNEVCPNLDCKVGEDCCPITNSNLDGMTCCDDPSYPCDKLDLVTACDEAWGAGTVFPAGKYTADKPCPIDGGRRYLVTGQTDLDETFECIARVGKSGYDLLGQAFTAAMQEDINGPGGCNEGFLRKDALLMVTFIATNPDDPGPLGSKGTPAGWAKAVLDAKHGDKNSVVMFNIGGCDCGPHEGECHPADRLCVLSAMFPYHHSEYGGVVDYGPAFDKAASLVETACAGFVVPG
ncbi:MAG TPA: hypothetical protein VGB85_14870 [Nannocystis sp.]